MDSVNASETSINARDVGEQVRCRHQLRILHRELVGECHAVRPSLAVLGSLACGVSERALNGI